ncbi:hypothetical protein LTR56_022436 [Elasticomyces elasticus]|nr:hypothetical protein LTR56_022436 [Elasticomyces elasticus]KAK3626825.1 hypothetical protein LTR22_023029 [Elasticomyces elasticus]KAK4904906.1 hypothetical protein LTR49_025722 [Elasticomyces elasticus]KAK5749099.1 hypothetical protein LTS12_020861 [Elasticomyces elasticus]
MANRITISSLLNPIPASEQTPSTAQPENPSTETPTETSAALDFFANGPVTYEGNTFDAACFSPAQTYVSLHPSQKNYKRLPPNLPVELILRGDPKWIVRHNLLRLALHYSDEEILEKANAGRPIAAFHNLRHVQNRLRQARTWLEKEVEPLLPKSNSEGPMDSRLRGMIEAMGPVKSERYKIRDWIREERLKNGAGLKRKADNAEEVSKRVKN